MHVKIYFLLLIITILKLINGRIEITFPTQLPVYVKLGGPLNLTCEHSEGFRILWLRSAPAPTPVNEDNYFHHRRGRQDYHVVGDAQGFELLESVDGGVSIATLMKQNVDNSDAASYKCATLSGSDKPFAFDVHVLRVLEESNFLVELSERVDISCELESDVGVVVEWGRGGRNITQRHAINVTHYHSRTKSTLSIFYPGEKDVGEYNCVFLLRSGVSLNHSVFLYSGPHIKFGGTSLNVLEGSDIKLECRAWGFPTPVVDWLRVDPVQPAHQLLHHSYHQPNIQMDDQTGVNKLRSTSNNTFLLTGASLENRGAYMCVASSLPLVDGVPTFLTTNATTIVRVRRRFGFVIPLVGLGCEAVILLTIIYVYERKRKKRKLMDEQPIT